MVAGAAVHVAVRAGRVVGSGQRQRARHMRQAGWDGEVTSARVEKQGAGAAGVGGGVEGGGGGQVATARLAGRGLAREGATAGCTSPVAPSSARHAMAPSSAQHHGRLPDGR